MNSRGYKPQDKQKITSNIVIFCFRVTRALPFENILDFHVRGNDSVGITFEGKQGLTLILSR